MAERIDINHNQAGQERWQMHRAGFVNFWYYDEEYFYFSNGKLLLRGANGSGKSITTQSFIPFVLDGNRSPERLDPFGSRDRKMDFYLLGENGEKEESTGYLFLEFHKPGSNRYRTIGIGQRAQKGKDLTFWGFLILEDDKRIGYDIPLYKEVGAKRIPLSKKELENQLGERNPLTTVQKEYMSLVNKHVFGFPRMEQYEQFVNLMIKVRAPKLNKDFKPSKIYDILNDSLQTLTDDDLRAMVDALEKMDGIQMRLEGLRESRKEAANIKREYDKYNRFLLSRKAKAYLQAKDKTIAEQQLLKQLNVELTKLTQELADTVHTKQQKQEEMAILNQEKSLLDAADLERAVARRQDCEQQIQRLQEQLAALADKEARHRERINELYQRQRGEKQELAREEQVGAALLQEAAELEEELQLAAQNLPRLTDAGLENRIAFSGLRREITEYRNQIRDGLAALKAQKQAEEQWSQAEEVRSQASLKWHQQLENWERTQALEEQERDKLVEQWHIFTSRCQELVILPEQLSAITSQVAAYQGLSEGAQIRKVVDGCRDSCRQALTDQKRDIEYNVREHRRELNEAQKQLTELRKQKEPVPLRKKTVQQARYILAEAEIVCKPFYETVEFAPQLSQAEKDLLEAQLGDTGLLDALVVAKKDLQQTLNLVTGYSEAIVRLPVPSVEEPRTDVKKTTAERLPLQPAVGLPDDLRTTVEEILAGLTCGTDLDIVNGTAPKGTFALSQNGAFHHGLLLGLSASEEEATFIGVEARRKQQEKRIAEKEAECKALVQELGRLEAEVQATQSQLEQLEQEYAQQPSDEDLLQAMDLLREAQRLLDAAKAELVQKEQEAQRLLTEKKAAASQAVQLCRLLPFMRQIPAYEEALTAAEQYLEALTDGERIGSRLELAAAKVQHSVESIEKEEEAVEEVSLQERVAKMEHKRYGAEITSIDEFLNQPENQQRAARLRQLAQELADATADHREAELKEVGLNRDLEHGQEALTDCKVREAQASALAEQLCTYYLEELELALVLSPEGADGRSLAKEAAACAGEGDPNKSVSEAIAAVSKVFQQNSANLLSYGAVLENVFADDPEHLRRRLVATASWQGKKLTWNEFYTVLDEAVKGNELLIQENDRKIFENILADTLSRKLNNRIQESRKWIQNMSALMSGMELSMNMELSLDWRAKQAEGDSELGTLELEKLLKRDRALLTSEDVEKVSTHFRTKVASARELAREKGETVNYAELVRGALDYRQWFEFRLFHRKNHENKRELTNSAFNRLSGGEKAMAMYVPLFAAVTSQYNKSEKPDHPKLIALDEAFAGVDEKNIASMFKLIEELDFDYIMNSQSLWGCYETVNTLKISELHRQGNASLVTIIHYLWNGRRRTAVDQ